MTDIQVLQYVNWDEFVRSLRRDVFDGEPFRRSRYLFRGVSSEDYGLTPSFDRIFGVGTNRQRVFRELLAAFREESEGQVPAAVLEDEVQTLALGQHYGLPTRLLDWTDSPYVAAFFAFKGALRHQPLSGRRVAIWVLHRSAPLWNAEIGVEIVSVPSVGNLRIRNQAGRFTLSRTPFATLEEYVAHSDYDGPALTKIVIPASEAKQSLADLAMMGITPARMFADLVGAAEAAEMRVRLDGDYR
jgi:hypothetical protein